MAGHGVWASGVVQGSGEEGCFHAGGRRRAKERERERQREEAAGARGELDALGRYEREALRSTLRRTAACSANARRVRRCREHTQEDLLHALDTRAMGHADVIERSSAPTPRGAAGLLTKRPCAAEWGLRAGYLTGERGWCRVSCHTCVLLRRHGVMGRSGLTLYVGRAGARGCCMPCVSPVRGGHGLVTATDLPRGRPLRRDAREETSVVFVVC